jgi:hypothetical protein
MAGHREADSDDWGDQIAKITFFGTMIFAALFIGAVFLFIL